MVNVLTRFKSNRVSMPGTGPTPRPAAHRYRRRQILESTPQQTLFTPMTERCITMGGNSDPIAFARFCAR